MSVLLALAAAALLPDGEVYMPVRIDCNLVSVRDQDKSDRSISRLTLLFPFEEKPRGDGHQIYALISLGDGRSWLRSATSSNTPDAEPAAVRRGAHIPRAFFATKLDLGNGETAFLLSDPRDEKRLSYDSRSLLTDGAGAVITRGKCRMTREADSK
jgi:hypothetical protein